MTRILLQVLHVCMRSCEQCPKRTGQTRGLLIDGCNYVVYLWLFPTRTRSHLTTCSRSNVHELLPAEASTARPRTGVPRQALAPGLDTRPRASPNPCGHRHVISGALLTFRLPLEAGRIGSHARVGVFVAQDVSHCSGLLRLVLCVHLAVRGDQRG
jgi:hypothetical protein